jgi:hypothetical protein
VFGEKSCIAAAKLRLFRVANRKVDGSFDKTAEYIASVSVAYWYFTTNSKWSFNRVIRQGFLLMLLWCANNWCELLEIYHKY